MLDGPVVLFNVVMQKNKYTKSLTVPQFNGKYNPNEFYPPLLRKVIDTSVGF